MITKEQQIIDAIVAQLARIAPGVVFTVNGNTLTCTEMLKTVAPERLTPFEVDEYPAIFVNSSESAVASLIIGLDDHTLSVQLYIITAEAGGQAAVRLLMADAHAAMYEDCTLGGLAIDTEYERHSMGNDNSPLPSLNYSVRYRTNRGQL